MSGSRLIRGASRSSVAPVHAGAVILLPVWLFGLALGIRLLLIPLLGLDGLYGQDAFAYSSCTHEILRMPWSATVCGDFYWPLGYPLLGALFSLVTHAEPFGAQLASTVAGAAVAPLVYWMVPDDRSGGMAAGLVVAVCGTLILSSILVMSDAAGLFWATLSGCLLLRWERASCGEAARRVWLLLAAAALGLAVMTRWIFGGLLIPFGTFVIVAAWHSVRTGIVAPSSGSVLSVPTASPEALSIRAGLTRLLWPCGGAVLVFLLIVLPQLYVNLHSSHPLSNDSWITGWNPANAWRTSIDTPNGHFTYRLPPLIFYAEPLFHPSYLFPLLTPCVFYGAWRLRRSPALILLGGWIVTLYVYLVGTGQENMRFGLALFSPVAVLAGMGLFSPPARLQNYRRWLILALSLVLTIPFSCRLLGHFRAAAAAQLAAIRYVQSQVPHGATVVTFELSISLQHYTDLTVIDLFGSSRASLRRQVCRNTGGYLYVDSSALESQWVGKSPDEGFRWLRDSVGLIASGHEGAWTLYRIRPCSP